MLREYAASEKAHPSAKAVELFQRALEIQADEATTKWEPEGRRNEYIAIEIALMRELRGSVWGVSALDVDENAEGPPAWVTNRGKSSRGVKPFHGGALCSRPLVRRRSLTRQKTRDYIRASVAGVRGHSPRCATNGWG